MTQKDFNVLTFIVWTAVVGFTNPLIFGVGEPLLEGSVVVFCWCILMLMASFHEAMSDAQARIRRIDFELNWVEKYDPYFEHTELRKRR